MNFEPDNHPKRFTSPNDGFERNGIEQETGAVFTVSVFHGKPADPMKTSVVSIRLVLDKE